MTLLHLFYLTLLTVAVTGSREKRLVLHSMTDFTQELVKLKTEMHTELQVFRDELKLHNDELQVHKDELQVHKDELQVHKDELQVLKNELQHEHGSVYVRWGRTSCPQNGTTLIYKGYMAGKHYNQKGSGTYSVCLPEDPTWGKYQDRLQGDRAYIYGSEYQETDNFIFGKDVTNEDVPCAVCQVPAVSVMIPARVNCYPGWQMEYTGYLVANYHDHYSTDYVCLDGDPEFVTRGAGNTNGHLVFLVVGVCGALVCPPYFDNRELACVVCSL